MPETECNVRDLQECVKLMDIPGKNRHPDARPAGKISSAGRECHFSLRDFSFFPGSLRTPSMVCIRDMTGLVRIILGPT